jgi:F-type H+-transporting ATPase subunit gamma
MAKARAIVKRRKAVRNIKKITKTMQMIATAKFQKALKRAVATKPYSRKMRELVAELAQSVGEVTHPLLRQPAPNSHGTIALAVITSNRGLAGAYNGSVLRMASHFIHDQAAAGRKIDLFVAGKKGVNYFNFQKKPITQKLDQVSDTPKFEAVETVANQFIEQFVSGKYDAVYVAYMNFQSAGVQKPEVTMLLPLSGVESAKAGTAKPASGEPGGLKLNLIYDFIPDAQTLLDELLPLTVKTALFQYFLDATTSEHVARMVSMKSATDNADKMVKSLTMQYNRARQTQITTELSEIMGGVEAMKG